MKTRVVWKKLVENKPSNLVGLDIGSSAVKMVVGRYNRERFVVQQACQIELPEAQVQEADRVLAVQRCLQKSGLRDPYAVCALAGPEIVLSRFEFPSLPDGAIRQAVELEAQQACPFDFEQGVFDYQLVSGSEKRKSRKQEQQPVRGFLVLAPRPSVEKKTGWLRQAGGRTLYIDLEGLAAMNCLGHCRRDLEETVIMLDIGSGLTQVLVRAADGIPFIRSLPSGGRHLLGRISGELNRPESEVRAALFGQEEGDEELAAALKAAAHKWITDINETLRYALLQNPGAKLSRIWIGGGWALSGTLVSLLTRSLPAPVEVFNPFRDLVLEVPDEDEQRLVQNGPAFAVAAGLAMRTV